MTETKNISVLFYKNDKSSFLHHSHIWLWGFFTLLVALAQGATPLASLYLNGDGHEDQMYLLESVARQVPPPPAPPSTPVVKHPVTQKYHNQLLQQLPKMLANGINLSRPEDYMWLDPSGRPTSPPRTMSPQNQAQSTRKVCMNYMNIVPR